MANRRSFTGYDQSSMMQPSSMMSPRGNNDQVAQDAETLPYGEHPDTMRRRITPMVGEPQASNTMLQDMLAMLNGGQ